MLDISKFHPITIKRLLLGYRASLNLKEVHRRISVQEAIVVDISPARWAILNLAILVCVVHDIISNHIVPSLNTAHRSRVVE